jgi:hypothetical protein
LRPIAHGLRPEQSDLSFCQPFSRCASTHFNIEGRIQRAIISNQSGIDSSYHYYLKNYASMRKK